MVTRINPDGTETKMKELPTLLKTFNTQEEADKFIDDTFESDFTNNVLTYDKYHTELKDNKINVFGVKLEESK